MAHIIPGPFKTLASLCSRASLSQTAEDTYSRDMAHFKNIR